MDYERAKARWAYNKSTKGAYSLGYEISISGINGRDSKEMPGVTDANMRCRRYTHIEGSC